MLGLFIGDGYYSTSNRCVEISLKYDYKILHYLADYFNLKVYKYNYNYRLQFSRTRSLEFSKLTGYMPGAKTYNAFVPDKIPSLLHKYLIRGLIDADGNIRKSFAWRIFIASPVLKDFVMKFIHQHGLHYNVSEHKKSPGFTIEVGKCPQFLIWLYQSHPELAVQRKRAQINKFVDDIVRTYRMINCEK